jgi:DMSO/TMAO reductase YedYZ heme-binding membrane subunit
MMPLRKEIGIFMGTLALVHAFTYLYPNPDKILESYFWIKNGFISFTAFGFFALILTTLLLITSNNWAIRKL